MEDAKGGTVLDHVVPLPVFDCLQYANTVGGGGGGGVRGLVMTSGRHMGGTSCTSHQLVPSVLNSKQYLLTSNPCIYITRTRKSFEILKQLFV